MLDTYTYMWIMTIVIPRVRPCIYICAVTIHIVLLEELEHNSTVNCTIAS